MKKIITLLTFSLIIICSCKQTVDKTEYDSQVKIKDSLQLLVKNQQIQIDTLQKKLDSINTQIILARKAAPLNDFAFSKIALALMREMSKRNLKEGFVQKNPKLGREVLMYSFDQSGYNYQATLHKIAETGFTPNERQYVAICIAPIADKKTKEQFKDVYSGQELKDVTRIYEIFKNINENN